MAHMAEARRPGDRVRGNVVEELAGALEEHARFGYGERAPAVTGIAIVGSSLSSEFEPGESDLDHYVLTERPAGYLSESFARTVNEPGGWNSRLTAAIPACFGDIDCLGVLPESDLQTHMHGEYQVVRR